MNSSIKISGLCENYYILSRATLRQLEFKCCMSINRLDPRTLSVQQALRNITDPKLTSALKSVNKENAGRSQRSRAQQLNTLQKELENGRLVIVSSYDYDDAQISAEQNQSTNANVETPSYTDLYNDKAVIESVPPPPPLVCQEEKENWINVEYRYSDRKPVEGASYTIYHQGTRSQIAKGTINSCPHRVDLPLDVSMVDVIFDKDPIAKFISGRESQPKQFAANNPSWFEEMGQTLETAWNEAVETTGEAADWTWGLLQGDFNENPSIGQITTNAVITAIPVVDQVADARDLVANLKLLVWDERYDEPWPWLGFLFTLIGLIPSVGSLLKGVLKAIMKKAASLTGVLKVFNYFKKGNGVKWLKELKASKLKGYINDAIGLAHQMFDAVIAKLNQLKEYVPTALTSLMKEIDDILANLHKVKGQINAQMEKVGKEISEKLAKLLGKQTDEVSGGAAKGTVRQQQVAQKPVDEAVEGLPGDARPKKKEGSGSGNKGHGNEDNKLPTSNKPLRDQIKDLTPEEQELVKNFNAGFAPQGVSKEEALDFIFNTETGQAQLKAAKLGDPSADSATILNRVLEQVQSGKNVPVQREITTPLVKIVPENRTSAGYGPFFTTPEQLENARNSGRPLSDVFGLPGGSDSEVYRVFQIQPKDTATVFESTIAPTIELDGKLRTQGGLQQFLVPNRNQFQDADELYLIRDNY